MLRSEAVMFGVEVGAVPLCTDLEEIDVSGAVLKSIDLLFVFFLVKCVVVVLWVAFYGGDAVIQSDSS